MVYYCTGVLTGHPNPLVLRPDGTVQFIGEGGAPVGLFSFTEYETIEFDLKPSEQLFLYSDGVTECEYPDGSLWDEQGLSEMFAQNTGIDLEDFPTYLIDKLAGVHGTNDFTDDISGVLINPWPQNNDAHTLAA